MELEVYYANVRGMVKNKRYPNYLKTTDLDDLKEITRYDYTFTEYDKKRRCGENFIKSKYAVFDCDNDHSDDEEDWIDFKCCQEIFKDVEFVYITSKSNWKQKGSRTPRPRFHIVFGINEITQEKEFAEFLKKVQSKYPIFDRNAIDSGRFFFGTADSEIMESEGTLNLTEFIEKQEEQDKKFEEMCNSEYTIPEGTRNSTMSHIAGKILIRFGEDNESYSKFLEQAEKCDPPLDSTELDTIWNSAKNFYKKVSSKATYIKPDDYGKPVWDEPLPLEDYQVEEFPLDTLPKSIKLYVEALAETTQTPVDMAACSVLAIMSIATEGKYKIKGKEDWYEPLNLFTVIVAEPSERKSAIINAVTKPLNKYELDYNTKHAEEFETSKMAKRILDTKQKSMEANVSKGKATMEDISKIAREVSEFKEIKPKRLYVDDITTEKLTSVLLESNGKTAIVSSEGGIFDILSGMYSKNVNIDVMLKSYSGDMIRVDRVGRNSETILNPALSVLLTVQPIVINGLMSNPTFKGRGLTARFLYCYPTSIVGTRKYRTQAMSDFVYADYESLIINMLEDEEEELITLSNEADTLLEEFSNEFEVKLADEYKVIGEWAGKLVGNVLRIAGILARANIKRKHDLLSCNEDIIVSSEVMQNAIKIGKYFTSHAMMAFSVMGSNKTICDSKYLLDLIAKNNLKEFTIRDIMRTSSIFRTKEVLIPVIDKLIDHGYIACKHEEKMYRAGRPAGTRYLVNPNIKK